MKPTHPFVVTGVVILLVVGVLAFLETRREAPEPASMPVASSTPATPGSATSSSPAPAAASTTGDTAPAAATSTAQSDNAAPQPTTIRPVPLPEGLTMPPPRPEVDHCRALRDFAGNVMYTRQSGAPKHAVMEIVDTSPGPDTDTMRAVVNGAYDQPVQSTPGARRAFADQYAEVTFDVCLRAAGA